MGYYTDSIDSVAPKGGEKYVDKRINTVIDNTIKLLNKIRNVERVRLSNSPTKFAEVQREINKIFDRIEMLDPKSYLLQREELKLYNLLQDSIYKKFAIQNEIDKLEQKKNSGFIRKLIYGSASKFDLDLMKINYEEARVQNEFFYKVYQDFVKLDFDQKLDYSLRMQEMIINSLLNDEDVTFDKYKQLSSEKFTKKIMTDSLNNYLLNNLLAKQSDSYQTNSVAINSI